MFRRNIITILTVLFLAGLTSYYAVVKPTSEDKTVKVLEKHLTLEEIPSERDLAHIEDLSVVSKNPEPVPASERIIDWQVAPLNRLEIQQLIVDKSREYGVNTETALRIANCESNFNQYAASPISTAKGIYQFLDNRWAMSCEGDVFNAEDNIDCFMKLYPEHPSYWVSK